MNEGEQKWKAQGIGANRNELRQKGQTENANLGI
jgi:hypothetical protein